MNIKQFHMKYLWALIHPEMFLLPCGKKKPVKMKQISLNILPRYKNYYDTVTQQYTDTLTGMSGHFVMIDQNNNVLFNSLSRSLYPTSYWSSITLEVPDLAEEYDYTVKIKVILGFDVDDDFYPYTLRIKPKVTSYNLNIGHNLVSHFYTIHKTRQNARVPLETIKIGNTDSVDITAYQTDRFEVEVLCHSFDQTTEAYINDDYSPNYLLNPVYHAYTYETTSIRRRVGEILAFNRNHPVAPVENTSDELPTETLRQVECTRFGQTMTMTFDQMTEEEWDGTISMRIKSGLDLTTGENTTSSMSGVTLDNSNGRVEYAGNTMPISMSSGLPDDPTFITNINSDGSDVQETLINCVLKYDNPFRINIGLCAPVTFNPDQFGDALVDYWEVPSYYNMGCHYKRDEYAHCNTLLIAGKAYVSGSPNVYIRDGNNTKGITATSKYVAINERDEMLTYVGGFGGRVSDDYEYWWEQAGR